MFFNLIIRFKKKFSFTGPIFLIEMNTPIFPNIKSIKLFYILQILRHLMFPLLLSASTVSLTQTPKINLVFNTPTDSVLFFKECFTDINSFTKADDSISVLVLLKSAIETAHKKGFLTAAIDSFDWKKNNEKFAKIHLGRRYEICRINMKNIPPDYWSDIDYTDKEKNVMNNSDFKTITFRPVSFVRMAGLEEKILQKAENNGFPFARLSLENIKINGVSTTADLIFNKGKLFRFDTLKIVGDGRINSAFLYNYLEMKRNMPFSRIYLKKLSARISELPYIAQTKSPTVSFDAAGRASVNLFLDNKKASRFDFLLGIQPTTGPDGAQKFTITFNGTGDFLNFLGWGERFYANFENLRPQSPNINLKFSLPYIPKMVFGVDGSFDLYKRDTTYIETKSQLGINYYLGNGQTAKFFWLNNSASNLLLDTPTIIATHRLPPTLDYSTNSIGFEFLFRHLDYRPNPKSGWFLRLQGAAGLRNIKKNTDVLNLKDGNDKAFIFSSLYDTVTTSAYQYRIETQTDYFQPIGKRSTIKAGILSSSLISSSVVGTNEQYRIGGSKILRGFDEESIFATQFAVGTLEYRFLIGRNSYLYTFFDGAYIHNQTRTTDVNDTPYGIGAGITIETKVGLFGVTLAAGSQQHNGLDFRNIKTHFGYVSYF